MKTLTRASQQLFTRSPDEYFDSLPALLAYCRALKGRGIYREGEEHRLSAGAHGRPGQAAGEWV